jgi:[2Fe-2S] binding domain
MRRLHGPYRRTAGPFVHYTGVRSRQREDRDPRRIGDAGGAASAADAYVEEQVPQCGYCINGWIMTAAALLRDKKKPTDAEIKTALEGLKCRCGTHMGIMRAVKRASEMMG